MVILQQSSVSSSEATFWVCAACNWVNGKSDPICKCGKRPGAEAVSDSQQRCPPAAYHAPIVSVPMKGHTPNLAKSGEATYWVCPECNYVNGKTERTCKCGKGPPSLSTTDSTSSLRSGNGTPVAREHIKPFAPNSSVASFSDSKSSMSSVHMAPVVGASSESYGHTPSVASLSDSKSSIRSAPHAFAGTPMPSLGSVSGTPMPSLGSVSDSKSSKRSPHPAVGAAPGGFERAPSMASRSVDHSTTSNSTSSKNYSAPSADESFWVCAWCNWINKNTDEKSCKSCGNTPHASEALNYLSI